MGGLTGSQKTHKELIAIYGGSLNPPDIAHKKIAEELARHFNRVFVIPCGTRKDKQTTNMISHEIRIEMAKAAFTGLEKIKLDLFDLENDVFTSAYMLQKCYEGLFPDAMIWHVIGQDIIAGGGHNRSEIHRVWDHGAEIWRDLNFVVISRPGYGACREDMPPSSMALTVEGIVGSGTDIRNRVEKGEPIDELVDPKVIKIIEKYKLYKNRRKNIAFIK